MIKKTVLLIVSLFLLIGLFCTTVFLFPQWFINQAMLEWSIKKSGVFDQYSLESVQIDHQLKGALTRLIKIDVSDFCFVIVQESIEAQGCLDELSIQAQLSLLPLIKITYPDSLKIHFSSLQIKPVKGASHEESEQIDSLDLKALWNLSSHPLIPPLDLRIDELFFTQDDFEFKTFVEMTHLDHHWSLQSSYASLEKKNEMLVLQTQSNLELTQKDFVLESSQLRLKFDQTQFHLDFWAKLPNARLQFSTVVPAKLALEPMKLIQALGDFNGELQLDSFSDFLTPELAEQWSGLLHVKLQFKIQSPYSAISKRKIKSLVLIEHPRGQFDIELDNEIHSLLLRDLLLHTKLRFQIENFEEDLNALTQISFNWLPAPFNALDGKGEARLEFEPGPSEHILLARHQTQLDFKGAGQKINLLFKAIAQLDLQSWELTDIQTDLDIGDVTLVLPTIDTRSLPPQFLPDSRIQRSTPLQKPPSQSSPLSLDLELETRPEHPVVLKTNLLDEPIRLSLKAKLANSKLQKAQIKVLPLKTSFFRRPIELQYLVVTLFPETEPYLKGVLDFRLPQYLVTLDFEGPSSNVQTQLKSTPPLPLDDIYSVLLFGRPMLELEGSAREDAGQGARILSQGLLSLTTLYFFAGTPVQSLGYNPDRGMIEAQFGIGQNNSLRLSGGSQAGEREVGVRRALGSGWFIDTSVNQNAEQGSQTETIMLERIHAY